MLKRHPAFIYLIFPILSLFCFRQASYAQNNAHTTNDIKSKGHIYKNADEYKAFLDKITEENTNQLDKKIQKQYNKIITEKNTELLKQLNEKSFLFDTVAYPYLRSIFEYILERNSLDKNRFHFFIDRTTSVNAYSFEDGTIICNLGLVSIMDNENQIAMVFCHELGHYLLKHTNTAIVTQLEKYNSPEFLTQVNKIKRQTYNTKEQLEALMMHDVFDRRKHSRSQERAADSVGMLLFMKTGYGSSNIPRMFDLLDSAENKTTVCTIHDFFKQEKIAIDENWLKPERKMSFGAAEKKEIVDSLKTHPDCPERKMVMQSFFSRNMKTGPDLIIGNTQKLSDVKKIALFDEAAYAEDKDNLGFYLYRLIQNDYLYPVDQYIKGEIFNTLLSIYKHQKSHTLYIVVNSEYIPDDNNDEYAKLLKLLDRVTLREMSAITIAYYQNNKLFINASKEEINNLITF